MSQMQGQGAGGPVTSDQYVWDIGTLAWVKMSQPGAATILDGSDVTEGSVNDAAVYGNTAGTVSAKLRGLNAIALGIGTATAPQSATVTDASGIKVAANANRKKMVIINTGTVNVNFGDGQAAQLGKGITLTPNGTWVMDRNTFTTAAIYAICASSSTLAIQEYE